jgi:hypothetical protein
MHAANRLTEIPASELNPASAICNANLMALPTTK